MRTTKGNKEVPQIFLPNFPYLQKYNLIRLTPWQLVTLQQAWELAKIFRWLKNTTFDDEGNRILLQTAIII